jgi:hypothetical protein
MIERLRPYRVRLRFRAAQEDGSDTDGAGAKRQRGGNAPPIPDSAGSDDRQIDVIG